MAVALDPGPSHPVHVGPDAGGPHNVLGLYLPPVVELHAVGRHLGRTDAGDHLDAPGRELRGGRTAQRGVELGEDLWSVLDDEDLDLVYVDVREVGGQRFVDESVDLGRRLDPRGPAAYDDEGELRVGWLYGVEGGLLEALYDAVADPQRVREPAQREAVLPDAGDAEEVRLAAQRQDQVVVGILIAAVGDRDLAFEIDALELGPSEARPRIYEGPAQGLGDVVDVHLAADDPWHHRPEGEVVLPGEHHHPDVVAVLREVA